MKPINLFIGFDSREVAAFHVLAHSIVKRASRPVSITPLMQQSLRSSGFYDRERGPTESTEFSLTRFLVPFLSEYKGISIFMDCDMLALEDICELEYEMAKEQFTGEKHAVLCCQHDYIPASAAKFDGHRQTAYPKKNWSSLMVFNNELCRVLTPDYVSKATGLDLHRFNWLPEDKVGSLPLEWNWLVGEYPHKPDVNLIHYTNGGPWHKGYENVDYADLWRDELASIDVDSLKAYA